jgi:hypothetical protein
VSQKYTENYVDKYLEYLGRYQSRLRTLGGPLYEDVYDFELEHRLVEQCEAGGILSVLELPTKDFE